MKSRPAGDASSTSNILGEERQPERRSLREKRQPTHFRDYEAQLNNCTLTSCFFTGAINIREPVSFEEAIGQPEWETIMQEELEALNKNQTNCDPITCKWAYKLKKKPYGTVDRYKAKLVAHVFS